MRCNVLSWPSADPDLIRLEGRAIIELVARPFLWSPPAIGKVGIILPVGSKYIMTARPSVVAYLITNRLVIQRWLTGAIQATSAQGKKCRFGS